MADRETEKQTDDHDEVHRPAVAVALLCTTAAVSIIAIVINLGKDSLSAIAATASVASALTLVAFIMRSGRR